MKYQLRAYTIWEQGPRPKQEDSLFPKHNETNEQDRLFILCDGMGGHEAGEVASQTVCSAMSSAVLSANPNPEGGFTDEDFANALTAAFDALDAKDTGAVKKMGTTLTFLKLHENGATIAHIGDSRVYHVRPGKGIDDTKILFQTYDHSLVNDLVKIGELTPEEAKTSRQKNVITRAMQPNMERRPRADIYHTQDIRPGDFFMLCSDGILEQMEDENIQYLFSHSAGNAEQKVKEIIDVTVNNHDNHTAILVEILDVIGAPVAPIAPVAPKKLGPVSASQKVEERTLINKPARRSAADGFVDFMRKNNKLVLGVAIGLACSLIILLLVGNKEQVEPVENGNDTEIPVGQGGDNKGSQEIKEDSDAGKTTPMTSPDDKRVPDDSADNPIRPEDKVNLEKPDAELRKPDADLQKLQAESQKLRTEPQKLDDSQPQSGLDKLEALTNREQKTDSSQLAKPANEVKNSLNEALKNNGNSNPASSAQQTGDLLREVGGENLSEGKTTDEAPGNDEPVKKP